MKQPTMSSLLSLSRVGSCSANSPADWGMRVRAETPKGTITIAIICKKKGKESSLTKTPVDGLGTYSEEPSPAGLLVIGSDESKEACNNKTCDIGDSTAETKNGKSEVELFRLKKSKDQPESRGNLQYLINHHYLLYGGPSLQ